MNGVAKWSVRLGGALVIYSTLIYMTNFLPVDFWETLSNLFAAKDNHTFYKVVATEGRRSYALPTLFWGVGLIIIGKVYADKSNR